MQVTQTLADGLKREFKVVVPAEEIASRADAQLEDMKDKVEEINEDGEEDKEKRHLRTPHSLPSRFSWLPMSPRRLHIRHS